MSNKSSLQCIIQDQLTSLDDSDCYASAWSQAKSQAEAHSSSSSQRENQVKWGGRGKGGRGLARRTLQPHDVVIEGISLEYITDSNNGTSSKLLLDGSPSTVLKLLGSHIYAIVGRNGSGKSTLLRRISAKKIPGFPTHLTSMYIPQEVFGFGREDVSFINDGTFTLEEEQNQHDMHDMDNLSEHDDNEERVVTPLILAKAYHDAQIQKSQEANKITIQSLEHQIDELDMNDENDCTKMEELCEQIAILEDENNDDNNIDDDHLNEISEAFHFFSIPTNVWEQPMTQLSGGIRKKILLACVLLCNPDLLLLDEPTNHLDLNGIFQLRELISTICTKRKTTVVLVSHDVDLMNDISTDIIHLWNQTLSYYPGNYANFEKVKNQSDLHKLRQHRTLERQRNTMVKSIENLKKQSTGNYKSDRKLKKVIENKKKKLERHGIEKDSNGHRWSVQKSGTGIKEGSINSIDSSNRNKLSYSQLLKRAETNLAPVPDKAVQFIFRNTTCSWGEPLIMVMDMGHGYNIQDVTNITNNDTEHPPENNDKITNPLKKDGMLFDCVDFCLNEGSKTFILGSNGSGKSTLLKILAKFIHPIEGTIHHAHGLNVGYFHQHIADDLIQTALSNHSSGSTTAKAKFITPLSLLQKMFHSKTEQELRGELSSFGLHGKQVTTNIKYLSGGERCRLCLSILMLNDPQVLILDEPTNHLDVESVNALIYGIQKWNGTVVIVSHDANFIRMVGGDCFVLMEEEKKLRRIPNGIDYYLEHFFIL